MSRRVKAFNFHFHNGGQWEVPVEFVGDIWIKRVSTSLGRINDGEIVEIHPSEAFRIEILPEADTFQSTDINQGGLEAGMFETVIKNHDIERLTVEWDNSDSDEVYFPFETTEVSGTSNKFMSGKVHGNKLYIVIDINNTVEDIFKV
ncbi:hypothetical protein HYQ40_01660 [Aerococcaceae bacterium DSM 111021]|nr:hypothetical protein [Aerococcaceae bacterium DSM 111021]